MAITLNAYLRITILDKYIAMGGYQRRQLFRKLNEELTAQDKPTVSIETMDGDLRAMRTHFNAPIECTPSSGYYYTIENFSLFNDELSSSELHDLEFAMDLLDTRYTDIPQVRTALHVLGRIYRRQAGANRATRIVFAAAQSETKGGEWLKRLQMAHDNRECLSVKTCASGTGRIVRYRLSPWAFVENGDGLDVLGYCADAGQVVQLPVGQIMDIDSAKGLSFRSADDFNIEDFVRCGKNRAVAEVYV